MNCVLLSSFLTSSDTDLSPFEVKFGTSVILMSWGSFKPILVFAQCGLRDCRRIIRAQRNFYMHETNETETCLRLTLVLWRS